MDLSAPHNNSTHTSINDLINKEDCTLSYVTIDDAIREIVKQGRGSLMCKVDISDAFKIVPILPTQYHLYCIRWEDNYYYYQTLSFGCRSSPKIFDQVSQAICWIAENNYKIACIFHFLDDFLTIDHPSFIAERTMALLNLIFKRLNIPLAKHKTAGPCTVVEYLGIILDSDKMEARLPRDKVERILQLLTSFACKTSCTKRQLLQLLGHLCFAMRVIPSGRSFVSYLLKLASSVKILNHCVKLDSGCREDMRMWRLLLSNWNGVSLFRENQFSIAPDIDLYTDASSTLGFGGYHRGQWFAAPWPSNLPTNEDADVSMAFRELYPIVVAAILWSEQWQRKRILFHCDNLATVQIIRKGRSKISQINLLMRQLTWLTLKHNFSIYAEHVPGVQNRVADALSRFQMETFRKLVPEAAPLPCTCPPLDQVLWSFERVQLR